MKRRGNWGKGRILILEASVVSIGPVMKRFLSTTPSPRDGDVWMDKLCFSRVEISPKESSSQ